MRTPSLFLMQLPISSPQLVSGSLATTRFGMTQSSVSRGGGRGPLVFEPRLIGGLKTTVIKRVACGDMFTACLTGEHLITHNFNNT